MEAAAAVEGKDILKIVPKEFYYTVDIGYGFIIPVCYRFSISPIYSIDGINICLHCTLSWLWNNMDHWFNFTKVRMHNYLHFGGRVREITAEHGPLSKFFKKCLKLLFALSRG